MAKSPDRLRGDHPAVDATARRLERRLRGIGYPTVDLEDYGPHGVRIRAFPPTAPFEDSYYIRADEEGRSQISHLRVPSERKPRRSH